MPSAAVPDADPSDPQSAFCDADACPIPQAPPRVRLADARVTERPVVASPPPSAPLCAGLPPAEPLVAPDAPAVVAGWPGWPALAGITRVDATHYTLARDLIDRVLATPTPLLRAARIVPAIADGQPVGVKLYAIRPGSPLAETSRTNPIVPSPQSPRRREPLSSSSSTAPRSGYLSSTESSCWARGAPSSPTAGDSRLVGRSSTIRGSSESFRSSIPLP